jgi:hypothetical protein
MTTETSTKRKVQRSPNYPFISLGEALGKLQTVYEQEKRSRTSYTVILKHLGYREERGGVGGRTLSALIQYGLLDQQGGECWVSDLGYQLLHFPESSPERENALRQAAQKPALFRELLAAYKDGLPSDDTLRTYLLKKGFNPTKTSDFIQVFRETISLAKLTRGVYDVSAEEGQKMDSQPNSMDTKGVQPIGGSDVRLYSWALSIPRNVRAELKLFGRDLRQEDIRRLKKQLELLEEALLDSGAN